MRCLYCGKELALLKRLTGGGEFCSEGHKRRYQEEYDRIALTRLLQAQRKTQSPSAPAPSPPASDRPSTAEEPIAEQSVQPEAQPFAETAGFLLTPPAPEQIAESELPRLESWVEASLPPDAPPWCVRQNSPVPSSAGLLPLKVSNSDYDTGVASGAGLIGDQIPATSTSAVWSVSSVAKRPTSNLLPPGLPIIVSVPLKAPNVTADPIEPARFPTGPEFHESHLLELLPAAVEFLAEDSDVVLNVAGRDQPVLEARMPPSEPAGAPPAQFSVPSSLDQEVYEEAGTPRATLEALSKLHRFMQQDRSSVQSSDKQDQVERVSAVAVVDAVRVADAVGVVDAVAVAEEVSASQESLPRLAGGLLDIPIKIFTPAKRGPVRANPAVARVPVLLPRLKTLPLRPKLALASGAALPEEIIVSPSTSVPSAKPSLASNRATEVAQKAGAWKPREQGGQPMAAKALEGDPGEQAAQKARRTEASSVLGAAARQVPNPAGVTKTSATTKSEQQARAGTRDAGSVANSRDADSSDKLASSPDVPGIPSFGNIGRPAVSFTGSLKVKVGTVLLLVVGAGVAYLAWGTGKSTTIPVSPPSASADPTGPSNILGDRGWVVGWGADSSNAASGREITMYRPSLKLSDYRIEFQGDIDSKSMGWVFRASDPENYYAMKLTMVSGGLSPKVELFKYVMAKGRQTQVGRVPVDVEIKNDMVFKVRVDVQGSKFTTYVESQPVDVWTDDQLKTGGVGFLNERGERGQIKSVSIRYLNGGGK